MTGIVTLSIEIELGWGYHDIGDYRKLSPDRTAETRTLSRLLDLCDELALPITFDVIGHLLLDECDGSHPGPHPNGWFAADPGSNVSEDPLFYAPDLVYQILNAEVDHDIGTHTFSHILFDRASSEVINWELDRVRDAHRDLGIETPVSLVPPRNLFPPVTEVKEHGIEVVRRPSQNPPTSPINEYFWNMFRTSPVQAPRLVDGIVETYIVDASSLTAGHLPMGQKSAHLSYRPIPSIIRKYLQQRSVVTSVRGCVSEDSAVHLWTHLHDMANSTQFDLTKRTLHYLAEKRDQGELDVVTMSGLPEYVFTDP